MKPNTPAGRRLPRQIEMLDAEMADILRAKTEAERLDIAGRMWEAARALLQNLLRAEHPEWSDEALRRAVARRLAHDHS